MAETIQPDLKAIKAAVSTLDPELIKKIADLRREDQARTKPAAETPGGLTSIHGSKLQGTDYDQSEHRMQSTTLGVQQYPPISTQEDSESTPPPSKPRRKSSGEHPELSDLSDAKKIPIEIPKPKEIRDKFAGRIVGQEEAVWAFSNLLAKVLSGRRAKTGKPIDAIFMPGPSGVGKTEIVYTFAELLAEHADPKKTAKNGNPREKVVKINGGEFESSGSAARLIGASPGHVGAIDSRFSGGTEPLLSQSTLDEHKITFIDDSGQEQSIVIVLVDEAEKAHESVHRVLLSALDRGDARMGDNKTTRFNNVIFFFTSNIGNQAVEAFREGPGPAVERDTVLPEHIEDVLRESQIKPITKDIVIKAFKEGFPPEYRGRINSLIVFSPLDQDDLEKIVGIKIKDAEDEFEENDVNVRLQISNNVVKWLIDKGYNPSEGARQLDKVITSTIKDPLNMVADKINGRIVSVDMELGNEKPAFYLVEGELPVAS